MRPAAGKNAGSDRIRRAIHFWEFGFELRQVRVGDLPSHAKHVVPMLDHAWLQPLHRGERSGRVLHLPDAYVDFAITGREVGAFGGLEAILVPDRPVRNIHLSSGSALIFAELIGKNRCAR